MKISVRKYLRAGVRRLVHGPMHRRLGIREDHAELIREIRSARLTYLSEEKLASIVTCAVRAQELGLDGRFIETGCALGGSAALIARVKDASRSLFVYDVFGQIPPPTQEDGEDVAARYETIVGGESVGIDGDKYYGYETDLFRKVQGNLRRLGVDEGRDNVRLVQGLVQDTLEVDGPVAFAHIDVDWYEPVWTSLERIAPKLVAGGSIILDDYNAWSGCRRATDEYFAGKGHLFARDLSAGSLKVTRLAPPKANQS